MLNKKTPYYRCLLIEELEIRNKKNANYSLRAFAKALEIDPGSLSRIVNGKKFPSRREIFKISENLCLSPEGLKKFNQSVAFSKEAIVFSELDRQIEPEFSTVSLDLFRIISDWYHYAILELTYHPNFKNDIKWISSQLKISFSEAKAAVNQSAFRMHERFNYLKAKKSRGKIKDTGPVHDVIQNMYYEDFKELEGYKFDIILKRAGFEPRVSSDSIRSVEVEGKQVLVHSVEYIFQKHNDQTKKNETLDPSERYFKAVLLGGEEFDSLKVDNRVIRYFQQSGKLKSAVIEDRWATLKGESFKGEVFFYPRKDSVNLEDAIQKGILSKPLPVDEYLFVQDNLIKKTKGQKIKKGKIRPALLN